MFAGLSNAKDSSPRNRTRSIRRRVYSSRPFSSRSAMFVPLLSIVLLLSALACRTDSGSQGVRPRQLRDVPARRLAFTFQADVDLPQGLLTEESKIVPAIQDDFDKRHPDYALSRTVVSPDNQRALALYNTTDEPSQTFRIALYSADGNFLRDVTPPELAVVFQDSVAWSADGSFIAFVARKSLQAEPSPTPIEQTEIPRPFPSASPVPTATVAPAFAPVAVFNTEQVYLCNRDGYDLKPLTTRDGLIYFALSWAPDTHALVALACKESEWQAREKEFKTPAGRPRLISLDGDERLLDDALAEAPPVWSPDSSKVATAFGVDIGIYDAASKAPTQARIELRERLLAASARFDEKSAPAKSKPADSPNKAGATPTNTPPVVTLPFSFNPIVRIEWPSPEKLYIETAYISVRSELIKTFSRWHLLVLSPQAAVLK
jgi:WD40-like Beta Propeller Repeat